MSIFAEVDHIERVFDLPNGGTYVALSNIELKIRKGEFISLVGHSGCGKSTLLNLIAGLDKPTRGGHYLRGSPGDGTGTRSHGGLPKLFSPALANGTRKTSPWPWNPLWAIAPEENNGVSSNITLTSSAYVMRPTNAPPTSPGA